MLAANDMQDFISASNPLSAVTFQSHTCASFSIAKTSLTGKEGQILAVKFERLRTKFVKLAAVLHI